MGYIGRTINIKSARTGRVASPVLCISRCFPSSFEFAQFLISLYMKDYGVYQIYTKFLGIYLTANQDNLPEDEILENRTILSTINAMYMVRDREQMEQDELAHKEMQEFINSLSTKHK
ncbi:TPA: hypothetical protein ACQVKY_005456 [Serratia marcescens]|uniref:Uncharacterized protein n=1 Tax=Serratia nevei TaxID=2703794 RepID=A0ABT7G5J4_9GAMM|nr:hypothetical protein [Serratia nevei]HAU4290852.1 hypothetical protein [Serratia marcescens]MDK5169022.1 hypothetical protein [Serratia nevei]MDK5298516.1 hypothetical protein [Serratia nevei]MEC5887232.1 hypothetical protein [Serratia nevei]HAU4297494.1 hypothetical protein [Serratia marcescens]